MVSCQKLLPPQNERTATGGNWIILPFMCETGGPAVPCVYALMERAVMTVEGTAAQRESLKTLHFAATSRLI